MKQKLLKLKKYIKTHKKQSVLIGIGIVAIVASIVTILVLCLGTKKKAPDKAASAGVWKNSIADLENEPVSEFDTEYKDTGKNTDRPYFIKINKTQNCIVVYQKDKEGQFTIPLKAFICSTGYDTPTGTFETSDKYTWKIINGNVWAQNATRVTGNVLIHSMPYVANDKTTLISSYYNQMGSTLSAGCIRMSVADSKWLLENCPKGTKVEIYESETEKLERPEAIKIPEDASWDPTDPDPANPWSQKQLAFEGAVAEKAVERGTQMNYLEGIRVLDTCGNDITRKVKITTSMDPFVNGTYIVKYDVKDATGKTATMTINYIVNDTTPPQLCGLKNAINFSSVSEVTKDSVLEGVSVLDNNEILNLNTVSVVMPSIAEGDNLITLNVSDSYGNMTTAQVHAIVKAAAPSLNLKAGISSVIPLSQKVDKAYALSRVTASSGGKTLSEDKISVEIKPLAWGYELHYRAIGNGGTIGTLKDTVTYPEFSIQVSGDTTVTSLTDQTQLLKNITVKSSLGEVVAGAKVNVSTQDNHDGSYLATYTYVYSSPIGDRTAQATGKVIFTGQPGAPAVTPAPTVNAPTSEPTQGPAQ